MKFLTCALLLLALASCKELFSYSPNEVRLEESQRNINQKQIEKLSALPVKDSFSFLVFGDSQRFYDDLEDFVKHVNSQHDVSFVILNGDITDFGQEREFEWVHRSLSKLNVPFITVIGNHDMLANGRKLYKEMFGDENFSFNFGNARFICFNSCSQEEGFNGTLPDLSWLDDQSQNRSEDGPLIFFSHIAPFHTEFDPQLAPSYVELLKSRNATLSVHGHQHNYSFGYPYNDGIGYLVASTINKRSYARVKVYNNAYDVAEEVF